jgi:C1A family cysteine protease
MAELKRRDSSFYGWIPDLPDARDHLFAVRPDTITNLPSAVDLREHCPKAVYDQGGVGSCTANAIAAAFEFCLLKEGLEDVMPSRLFIYYNERDVEGTVGTDSGAMIRDGVKSVASLGVCSEDEWPYDGTRTNRDGSWPAGHRGAQRPSNECYQDALKSISTAYQRVVRDLQQLKGCLADGFPFLLGFTVYSSFESEEVKRTGVMPMPDIANEDLMGGHAVLAVGYDDAEQRFLIRNSWGDDWGQGGYFTMPYQYLTQASLSSDFWAIRAVN